MSFVDVHVQAIEECRQEAYKVRNMLDFEDAFTGSKSKAPKGATSAEIFGSLDGAGALAKKIDEVWGSVKEEYGWGRSRMQGVEEALGKVAANFRNAAGASGA